jgi:hypothetical protein
MKHITELINQNTIDNCVHLGDEQLFNFSVDEINFIVSEFGGKRMVKLPQAETIFFEWFKINDPDVWDDLWNDNKYDEEDYAVSDELYSVSITLLPYILDDSGRGFPICDLINNDNYYFHIDNMIGEESKIIIDSAKELFRNTQKITIAQLLAIEISIAPIDIWHFAYKHKLNLNEAKKSVQELIDDDALVHLTQAEYLIQFLPF